MTAIFRKRGLFFTKYLRKFKKRVILGVPLIFGHEKELELEIIYFVGIKVRNVWQ